MDVTTNFVPARAWRAHALKNCMAIINAVNRLIEPELGEVSRQRMERSHDALRRMVSLLSEDLAQPAAREFTCSEDLVHSVIARVEDIAEAEGVQLFVRAGAGRLLGDAARLAEALCNIVLNAVQATPAGGAVYVATDEDPDGAQLWVVEDTGKGMPEAVLAQLGKPRFTHKAIGSGLGMAAALEVFERHAGVVRIESRPGSGTKVSILLPPRAGLDSPMILRVPPSAAFDDD